MSTALGDLKFLAKRYQAILELAEMVEDEKSLQSNIETLKKVHADLQVQVNSKRTEVGDLEDKASTTKKDSDAQVSESKAKLAAFVKKAEADTAELRERAKAEMSDEREKHIAAIRELQKQISDKQRDLEAVKTDIDKHSKLREKVKSDINKIKEIL